MVESDWQRAKDLFQACLDRQPPSRPAFLAEACGGDEALRREVELLLAAHEAWGDVPTPPPHGGSAALAPGARLGPYEVVSLLGAGGMGEVYRARDTRLGREVALKVLPEHLQRDALAQARFEREGRAVAALSHPGILALHDVGEQDGVAFAVTELLEGETLRARLSRAPLPWREAVDVAAAIADGLAAAHAKGIVHRDLKPENVFLTSDGRVKVLDFGLARVRLPLMDATAGGHATASVMTAPGTVMGTLGYMAPEQLRGEEATGAADLFALGCVLSEMVCGRAPFSRGTPAESIAAVLGAEAPRLDELSGLDVPAALVALVRRCLAPRPEQRPRSAAELARALRDLRDARPAAPQRRALPWAVAAVLLAAVVAVAVAWRGPPPAAAPAAIDSLAVLPLRNVSADPAQDYVAEGLTEALISDLARLDGLRVISRTSVMRYKKTDHAVPDIARELKVAAVMEGSVVRAGERMRITVRLIDARSDSPLWSSTLDRDVKDLLGLQNELARRVVEGVRPSLSAEERVRLGRVRSVDPEAHELYFKGRFHWNTRTPEGIARAREHFQQALERDPAYAPAWVGLAEYHSLMPFYSDLAPSESFPKALAAARKALEVDEGLGEAHAALAHVRCFYEWDWTGAEEGFQRALDLHPGSAETRHRYSRYLTARGRHDEALAQIDEAAQLDPLSLVLTANRGMVLYFARRWDEATAQLRKSLESDPRYVVAFWGLGLVSEQQGMQREALEALEEAARIAPAGTNVKASLGHAYARSGREPDARRLLAELEALRRQKYVHAYHFALIHAGLGERRAAQEQLERAYAERSTLLGYAAVDPRLDPLRGSAEFADLLRRMGLP